MHVLVAGFDQSGPPHEGAAKRFDQAIALCQRAGFDQILLRGDTELPPVLGRTVGFVASTTFVVAGGTNRIRDDVRPFVKWPIDSAFQIALPPDPTSCPSSEMQSESIRDRGEDRKNKSTSREHW